MCNMFDRYLCMLQQGCLLSKRHPYLLHHQMIMLNLPYVLLAMNRDACLSGLIRSCGLSLACYRSLLSKLGGLGFVLTFAGEDYLKMQGKRRNKIYFSFIGLCLICMIYECMKHLLYMYDIRKRF